MLYRTWKPLFVFNINDFVLQAVKVNILSTYKYSTASDGVISKYVHCDMIDDIDQCRYFKCPKQTKKPKTNYKPTMGRCGTSFRRHTLLFDIITFQKLAQNQVHIFYQFIQSWLRPKTTNLYSWHFCSRFKLSVADTALIRRPSNTNDHTISCTVIRLPADSQIQ